MKYRPNRNRIKWTVYIPVEIVEKIDDLKLKGKYKSDIVEKALINYLQERYYMVIEDK